MKNFKENYKLLQEKYSLPSYEELDKNFEILNSEEKVELSFPLALVRRRMCEKLSWISSGIQTIIQPNPSSLVSIEESSFFTKEEKKEELIKLLKELMHLVRSSVDLDIENSEEKDAININETFKKWTELKPKIKEFSKKMKDGWKKETKVTKKPKTTHNYLG
ncbi:hypothetical protein HN992_03235 [Candidatus Woesearchaeota archaeon]|jgi:hypothetical protein|nr:hypothetical protein [Candidatus Woesearchaeota archaeon]MBT3438929.1 hypothetical protein [Candidatus Woesearchaeota archaeon]MBT4058185.1 hypothetical protein [Candidatus Woesearchaeota archaeon]MBT4206850.1 hypothetical protein [Candidatus Woesearchaeota archaeon]MBT4731024.1 hypothetical protein [Candidatus Woesearchaeota archaeon]